MSNSLSLFITQSTPTGKLICCSPTVVCIHTRPLQQTTAIHGHEKASQPEQAGSPYVSAQRASPRLTSSLLIRIVYKKKWTKVYRACLDELFGVQSEESSAKLRRVHYEHPYNITDKFICFDKKLIVLPLWMKGKFLCNHGFLVNYGYNRWDERSNQIATRLYIRDLKIRRRGRRQRERQKSNRF